MQSLSLRQRLRQKIEAKQIQRGAKRLSSSSAKTEVIESKYHTCVADFIRRKTLQQYNHSDHDQKVPDCVVRAVFVGDQEQIEIESDSLELIVMHYQNGWYACSGAIGIIDRARKGDTQIFMGEENLFFLDENGTKPNVKHVLTRFDDLEALKKLGPIPLVCAKEDHEWKPEWGSIV
jgi:hypothetical protein